MVEIAGTCQNLVSGRVRGLMKTNNLAVMHMHVLRHFNLECIVFKNITLRFL